MYHYFYKITNNINGHFYYGIHSTDNLDDGYMGSGRYLRRAYKKFGIENFTKEIVKFFENREDCANFEKEIVTEELVNDPNCYNISLGGEQTSCKGTVSVYDKDEQIYKRVLIKDKSKYESINGDKVQVYDILEKIHKRVSTEEYVSNKDRYNSVNPFPKNSIFVYLKADESKKIFLINKDEFDDKLHTISDNHFQKGKVLVKDTNGRKFFVDINDALISSNKRKQWSDLLVRLNYSNLRFGWNGFLIWLFSLVGRAARLKNLSIECKPMRGIDALLTQVRFL